MRWSSGQKKISRGLIWTQHEMSLIHDVVDLVADIMRSVRVLTGPWNGTVYSIGPAW